MNNQLASIDRQLHNLRVVLKKDNAKLKRRQAAGLWTGDLDAVIADLNAQIAALVDSRKANAKALAASIRAGLSKKP